MPGPTPLVTVARRIPWRRVIFAATLAYRKGTGAYNGLSDSERKRFGDLIKKSQGRPSNLTQRERDRIRELAGKALDAARKA